MADITQASCNRDFLELVAAMQRETGRILELVEPVAQMFPDLRPRHVPGVLLLLGKEAEAVELAVLLARVSLEEEELDPTPDRIKAKVAADYLTAALLMAAPWEVSRDPV